MALNRIPGPLDLMAGALPPDAGTLSRTSTAAPGAVGANIDRTRLSDADRDFIAKVAGRRMDGSPLPLESLLGLREQFLRQYDEAAGHFGAQSGAALFTKATLAQLVELIAEVESPRGKAAENLKQVLEKASNPNAKIDDKEFSDAIGKVLEAERDIQLRNPNDGTGGDAMDLVGKSMMVISRRKTAELSRLVQNAKRPGNDVSDDDLRNALTAVLGIERQKQLLGASDDDDQDNVLNSPLLGEVLEIAKDRREQRLRSLLEEAKRPGSRVTDEQLSNAVGEVLGAERQRQLLGMADSTSPLANKLIEQTLRLGNERRKAALKNLLNNARQPGNAVTKKQVQEAVAGMLGVERQRQLMGAPDDDEGDQEIWNLFEEASKLYGTSETPTSGSSAPSNLMRMDEVKIIGRVPLR